MLPDSGDVRNQVAWRRHLPPGSDLEAVDLLARRSLPRAWRRLWEEQPEATAIVSLADTAASPLSRGYLNRVTAALARALARRGVQRGDRVLVSARTSAGLLLLYLATLRLGAVVVPANTAYREREIGHIVRDCEPSLAIVDDPERASWARRATPSGDGLPIIDPAETPSLHPGPDAPEPSLDEVGPDDLAMICYTSGTTGTPKGAMLSHGNLLASAEAVTLAWRWTERDGLVLTLPLFHIHGLGVGVNGSLLAGGRILLLPRFDPAMVLAAAARPDATLFFGVPTMYVRLIDALEEAPAQAAALASLRLLVSGSAPLLAPVWLRMRELAGQEILERYGMTETVMNISNPYDGERRPGTVGLPLPGVEARIMAGEREASDDEDGEIYLRGPNVFGGYWNRPEATREALGSDGWLRTGDLGRRSTDGYVTIAGRVRELIITGGFNVYPREVEEVLEEHPAVREAAVAGRPSREWGEEVAGFVVAADPAAPPSELELIDWCREHLAPFKRPRRITMVASLPRNALGKIVRGDLP